MRAPLPPREHARLAALHALDVLDTPPEQAYDDLVALAAHICGTPIALVSLVGAERQWFKARVGIDVPETPVAHSFCAHAILTPDEAMIVGDSHDDPRFVDNPLVTGPPKIRFYAGVPLLTPEHHPLGTLCVIDRVPRQLSPDQVDALKRLARLVSEHLEARNVARMLSREGERVSSLTSTLERVVRNLREVVFETDAAGLWTYLNPAWAEITGFELSDSLGKPFFEFLHPDDVELNRQRFEPLIRREKEYCRHEIRYRTADGGFRWIEVHARLVLTADDQIAGTSGTLRDITSQRAMAAELVHAREEALTASRLKSEFLANMSHEIRTPINGVLGLTTLLLDTPLSAEQREYAEGVTQSAEALLGIINDVLDLSKIEAGRLDIERLPVDVSRLLAQIRDTVGLKARMKGLAFEVVCARDLPAVVVGDGGRLRQVLLNLADNAVKFTDAGHVRVEAARQFSPDGSESLRFTVRDTGMGIPAEKIRVIFEKFAQADSTTARRFGGTGLGLAICQQLVSLMGGSIHVESVVGEGSTFTFDVPLHAWEPGTVENQSELDGSTTYHVARRMPTHVLLVEDNAINQKVATRFLAKEGCVVDVADDGNMALELVARARYDAIFMDCQMPGMDGYETTRRIRGLQDYVSVPIIGVTAHAMVGDREKCLAAGMTDYLAKPLHPDALHAALLRAAETMPPEEHVGHNAHRSSDFDGATLLNAFDGHVEDVRELVALVEASVPKYVADLRAAWQAGDLRTLASLAHTISGAVGNVGAAHLAGVARAVEQTARSANPVDEAAVRGLEQAAQELLQRMRAWVATLPASGQVART
ncbi:MAG: response regulator [Acidobacteria bacterium]|nr:response regulator [Acidobacteriota bacterium]